MQRQVSLRSIHVEPLRGWYLSQMQGIDINMEISAGTCIAVGVGVGGGVSHAGREEAELEGSQKEIQSNSAQTRRGANYAHMQWPWK